MVFMCSIFKGSKNKTGKDAVKQMLAHCSVYFLNVSILGFQLIVFCFINHRLQGMSTGSSFGFMRASDAQKFCGGFQDL